MKKQNENVNIIDRPLAYWDIESLSNIFMFAVYLPESKILSEKDNVRDKLVFFYLFDGVEMTDSLQAMIIDKIFEKNTSLDKSKTDVMFMDMKEENVNMLMANWFCLNDAAAFESSSKSSYIDIVGSPGSDLTSSEDVPYMIGYNTANYDCIMMSLYFTEAWRLESNPDDIFGTVTPKFDTTTARIMRDQNNRLFEAYKDDMRQGLSGKAKNIYENMLKSGLYVDAAKVNDKVYKMPLKRIMGMMGMDIFEDPLVAGEKPVTKSEDIATLFAYNASDCVKLMQLFKHEAYAAQFSLKKGLLKAYKDIVYKTKNGKDTVRVNRMKIDDTSAKFAQRVLCPDGYLPDIKAVSFEYPKGSGRNVLKELREWCSEKFKDHPEVLTDNIYPILDWYGQIEGRNFDDSEHYIETYGNDMILPMRLSDIPSPRTTIPYFKADGTPDRTYVNFGTGGIHGAEYDKDKYEEDVKAYEKEKARIDWFVSHFTKEELPKLPTTVTIEGQKYKRSEFVTVRADKTFKIKYPKPVELFVQDKKSGKWNLNKKYAWCSDNEVDHQDFTSYYPCLLMNMQAYVNKNLGEDRYKEQFDNKGLFGKYMKDKERPESERQFYAVMRDGTKLILNSASGASDTAYDNPIRMNNNIISMRLIGQMYAYLIGQAETLAGFKVISTNTDGLYAVCNKDNREQLRQVLADTAKSVGVDIEPEEMRLISKDANNRIEMSLDGKILSASGGDTACYKGPTPSKALSHPALIDRLMVDYLAKYGIDEPFDYDRAAEVLENVKKTTDNVDILILYQQIINSSEGSVRYIFAEIDGKIRTFQHNNRIFAIRKPGAHLWMANGQNRGEGHDETADKVLREYGVNPADYTNTRIIKISRVDPEQNMMIYNGALDELPKEVAKEFVENLDDGYYLDMLRVTYSNWSNCEESGEVEEEA